MVVMLVKVRVSVVDIGDGRAVGGGGSCIDGGEPRR